MGRYHYSGVDRQGRGIRGYFDAPTEAEARSRARLLGIRVKKLTIGGSGVSSFEWKPITVDKKGNIHLDLKIPGVSFKEVTVFTRQFSVLVNAGVSVVQAIEMLDDQSENKYFKSVLLSIRTRIKNGEELADAMEKHPDVFDSLYTSLVRAGTASGALDKMLEKLSIYLERSNKLRRQFMGAISYPLGVVVVAVCLVIFELLFVVPMFEGYFSEAGQELPAFTLLVINASNFLIDNIIIFIMAGILAVVGFKKWSDTPSGRAQIDASMLKIPLFGQVIQKISLARFATTMSTLVSGGVALIEALAVCARASGNMYVEGQIVKLRDEVSQGRSMAEAMDKIDIIPKMMTGMVKVGEASGQLDQMFEKVSEFYEEEVDSVMSQVLKLMEPILFIVLGGLVGIVLIAMYLPIFDLASTQLGS